MLKRSNIYVHLAGAASAAMVRPCRRDLVSSEARTGAPFTLAEGRMR
jgi:hypothetical protein